jgi:hypothetical protein
VVLIGMLYWIQKLRWSQYGWLLHHLPFFARQSAVDCGGDFYCAASASKEALGLTLRSTLQAG